MSQTASVASAEQKTCVQSLEEIWWVGGGPFSEVADLIEDAATLLRQEILVADHRNCQGGDLDPCRCQTDAAFARAQLSRLERLERDLTVALGIQRVIQGKRRRAAEADERLVYWETHPEELDNTWF